MTVYNYKNLPGITRGKWDLGVGDDIEFEIKGINHILTVNWCGLFKRRDFFDIFKALRIGLKKKELATQIYGYESGYSWQVFPEYRYEDMAAATRMIWFLMGLAQEKKTKMKELKELINPREDPDILMMQALMKKTYWDPCPEEMKLAASRIIGVDCRELLKVKPLKMA